MQNSAENKFDALFQHQLKEFTPDVTLMNSSYDIFLAEQQKKRRRYMLWQLFTLFFTAFLFLSYFFSMQKSPTDKTVSEKSNTLIQPDNLSIKATSSSGDNLNFSQKDNLKDITSFDTKRARLTAGKENGTLQSGNNDSVHKRMESKSSKDATATNAYSADSLQIIEKKKINSFSPDDSLLKKKIKNTVDTLYIVW